MSIATTSSFTLRLGGLADPISKQLKAQKLKFNKVDIVFLQKGLDSVNYLHINRYVTDKESTTLRTRIFKAVEKHVQSFNNNQSRINN